MTSSLPPDAPEYPSATILDSRRLTGANWYSRHAGAVLEVRLHTDADRRAVDHWPYEARDIATTLGWTDSEFVARHGAGSATCFLSAPLDALMTATSVAEWAWVHAEAHVARQDGIPVETTDALPLLRQQLDEERSRRSASVRLVHAATARGLGVHWDDEHVAVGSGCGVHRWPVDQVPTPDEVPWNRCFDVPTVLVTGSNGKTTTTRLIARMFRRMGRCTGWCSSDGVCVEDADGSPQELAHGDWTGPAGARLVLDDPRVQAAVLETARGGILRRGLATTHATAAVITNISLDHLGEYGVQSLEDLAGVKAVVAHALTPPGNLVLNADDPTLVALGRTLRVPVVWFSLTAPNALVEQGFEAHGRGVCVREDHLHVGLAGTWHDVGALQMMPLTWGGTARHNVANAAAAALTATCAGVPIDAVRATLAEFGARAEDNPGRLRHWKVGGVDALVDYAHNPDGLRALAEVARSLPARRRLLVLGQAGNRDDAQLEALARIACEALRPDHVILKEMSATLRGRAPGVVPAVLRAALQRAGLGPDQLSVAPTELDAVRAAFAWSRPGDLLVLPTHAEKDAVAAWLSQLLASGWEAGTALP